MLKRDLDLIFSNKTLLYETKVDLILNCSLECVIIFVWSKQEDTGERSKKTTLENQRFSQKTDQIPSKTDF